MAVQLEGTARWQKDRLQTPAVITNATDEYRGEIDVIGNFLKECYIVNVGSTIRIREFFKAYQEWCCGENNEHACSERFLSLRLKEMGYERTRTADAQYWKGIMLKAVLS
jgi:putative DNA primase/helicase